jgi:hypothetical protein
MTTGNTTLLGLALPVEGELDGTWGDVVNDSITSLVDSAVAGTTTLSANADVTLTTTVLAANQARQAILLWTASNGATTRNITAPAQSKPYIVINAGTGSIVLRGAGPTTGVTIVSGERCLAAWNGSDFVKVASSAAGNAAGSNTQVQYNSSGAFAGSANLTFDGTTLTVNDVIDSSLTANKPVFTNGSKNLVSTGTLGADQGGTGQTTYTDGQLLIGNTTGNTLTKATLTAGTGISITNGNGSITIESSGGGGGTGSNIFLATNFGGF